MPGLTRLGIAKATGIAYHRVVIISVTSLGSYADTVLVLLASRHRVNSTERARLRVSVRAAARHISESLN